MARSIRLFHALAMVLIAAFFLWHGIKHAVPIGLAGPQCDGLTQGLPKVAFYSRELSNGRFPTWDPYVGTGTPDYPVRHHVMYPPTLLTVALLPPWLSILIDYAVAYVLMYIFGYLLFRRASSSPLAASAGAMALVFGGMNLHYIFYPYFSQTATWIPLVFLAIDGLFNPDSRKLRYLVLGAAALGMMILAGMINYLIYTLVFAAAYVLFRTRQAKGGGQTTPGMWRRVWLMSAAFVLLGLALGGARLAPLFDDADRLRGGYENWSSFRLLLMNDDMFLASLAPGAFNVYKVRHGGAILAYGLIAWTLCVSFVFAGRKSRLDWFWLAVFACGIATYFQTPIAHLLFAVLPGYGNFDPSRIWSVSGIALLWLALRALGQISADENARRLTLLAFALAVLWLLVFAFDHAQLRANIAYAARHFMPVAAAFAGLLAVVVFQRRLGLQRTAAALAMLLALEVYGRAVVSAERIDVRRLFRPTPITTTLQAAEKPFRVLRIGNRWDWVRDQRLYTQEALKFDGIEDLHAYSSMVDPELRSLLDAFRVGRDTRLNPFETGAALQPFLTDAPLNSGLANWLNARFVLSQLPLTTSASLVSVAEHAGLHLYENRQALPPYWIVHEARFVRNADEALAQIKRGLDWNRQVLLVGNGESLSGSNTATQVTHDQETPTEQHYRVKTDAPGYLVVTELYDKNWRVSVNGQPAALYRANVAFRAVAVPPGESEIVFRYVPRAFYWGVAISAFAAAVLILLTVLARRKENEPSD
jgi:hypothetical protein